MGQKHSINSTTKSILKSIPFLKQKFQRFLRVKVHRAKGSHFMWHKLATYSTSNMSSYILEVFMAMFLLIRKLIG